MPLRFRVTWRSPEVGSGATKYFHWPLSVVAPAMTDPATSHSGKRPGTSVMNTKILLPFTYRVRLSDLLGRKSEVVTIRDERVVVIPQIDSADLAVRVAWHGEMECTWRRHDGAYWRPVFHDGGRPAKDFSEFFGSLCRLYDRGVNSRWTDYPLFSATAAAELGPQARNAFDGLFRHQIPGYFKKMSDLGDPTYGDYRDWVTRNLLVIGRVVHVRTDLPAWGIGPVKGLDLQSRSPRVRIRDYPSSDGESLMWFPIDRFELAAGVLDRVGSPRSFPNRKLDVVEILDCNIPAFDVVGNARRVWKVASSTLEGLSVTHTEGRFLALLAETTQAMESGNEDRVKRAFLAWDEGRGNRIQMRYFGGEGAHAMRAMIAALRLA